MRTRSFDPAAGTQGHHPTENSVEPLPAYGANLASIFHLKTFDFTTARLPNQQTFAVTRLQSPTGIPARTRPIDPQPALSISVALSAVEKGVSRLWLSGREVNVPFQPRFGVSIVDLECSPAVTMEGAFDSLHFYIPREALSEIADDLGIKPMGTFATTFFGPDPFLTQFTKIFLPYLAVNLWPDALTLDHFALLLGSHLLQHYGKFSVGNTTLRGGLSPAQRRRATELLRENLGGRIALPELAAACGLSSSYFSRAFKTSFGISVHQWLTRHRLNHARDLLLTTALPLADIGLRSGFSDQAAFTRAFATSIGLSPGKWRKAHDSRSTDCFLWQEQMQKGVPIDLDHSVPAMHPNVLRSAPVAMTTR